MTTETREGRCTGHCCEKFWFGPGMYAAMERNIQSGPMNAVYRDSVYIKDMLVKLPPQILGKNGEPVVQGQADSYYTCKHYDVATGNCGAYEERPAMCRDYPSYGCAHACETVGCTAKNKGVSDADLMAREKLLSKYQTLKLSKELDAPKEI